MRTIINDAWDGISQPLINERVFTMPARLQVIKFVENGDAQLVGFSGLGMSGLICEPLAHFLPSQQRHDKTI